jgi:hypothetical protein
MKPWEDENLSLSTLRISMADTIGLRLRTQKAGEPPPKLLYQRMPEQAMSLMATIPSGTSAVSIPQQSGLYPISKHFPQEADQYLIVYARKPNDRYEAIEVLFQGQSFGIAQFQEYAWRRVEKKHGGLKVIDGRHAYFAPTREEWGGILRDGGFTAKAPSTMIFELTPEMLQSRVDRSGSGVLVRVPVHASKTLYDPSLLPAFARVELTLDPNPDSNCRWIGFVQFQKERAARSRPPEVLIPGFREWLKELARECGFQSWIFQPGMYFGDHREWWGDRNRRRTLHEGIDFLEGLSPDSHAKPIPEGTPVRAIAAGEVVAVLDDFLNKTVVVRHAAIRDEHGDVFHTFFSHIQPAPGIPRPVSKGDILGNVGISKITGAPTHLHLSGAWIPESICVNEMTIDQISATFAPLVLVNFNSLV